MNSAGQRRNQFAVSHLPAQFGAEDFSDNLPKPPISQIFCRIPVFLPHKFLCARIAIAAT
jgi:hypothetical protein